MYLTNYFEVILAMRVNQGLQSVLSMILLIRVCAFQLQSFEN